MRNALVLLVALCIASASCSSSPSRSAAAVSPTPTVAATTPPTTPTPTPASSATPTASPTPATMAGCFPHMSSPTDPDHPGPDYDQFNPTIGTNCMGTNNQVIDGIQKVVFLGDSVTAGTPPTPSEGIYRALLAAKLTEKFGPLEVSSCAQWGAHTSDFLDGKKELASCFPFLPVSKRTLVVFTNGGNDVATFAKQGMSGTPVADLLVEADTAVQKLRDAIDWLQDPAKFPNGVFILFGDNYEFTDGMGDPSVCPAASLFGLGQPWPDGRPVILRFNEGYMRTAMETKTDMIFMLERFCGHGYNASNPANECYQAGNENWFDLTCIHPNPTGHAELSNMFMTVVNGG